MTIKKTFAAIKRPDGKFGDQEEVTMGELEEAATLAWWKVGDHKKTEPKSLTMEDKVNALTNPLQGATYVTTQEAAYNVAYKSWKSQNDALEADAREKDAAFYNKMSTLPSGTKTC